MKVKSESKVIQLEEQAQYLAVAFDLSAPTFRHKKYEAYKGTRHAMPDELREQIPIMQPIINICMHIDELLT